MTEKNIRATIKNHAKQEQERIIKRMKEACNIKGKENPKQIWYVDEKYIDPIKKQELKNIKRRAKK
jgi:predicted PilT family ATPase